MNLTEKQFHILKRFQLIEEQHFTNEELIHIVRALSQKLFQDDEVFYQYLVSTKNIFEKGLLQ